ncbi:MAG: ABC transporter permease [Candidatus Omnitrophota bacterium]
MDYIIEGFIKAFKIIFSLDREFLSIVFTSVRISFSSTFLAAVLGIPAGIFLGTKKFKGREFVMTVLNTLMALPTVVVGLLLYSFFSRRGPMGEMGLLFTPTAMIIGQCVLAFPIVAALVSVGIRNLGDSPIVAARMLGAGNIQSALLFLREAKLIVITSALAAFGRVFSEVGVSMMLGGNIRFYTRNITTAIALETSRGAFGLGLALGIVLLLAAFFINIVVYNFRSKEA